MVRLLGAILFFISFTPAGYAQNRLNGQRYADSLHAALQHSVSDSARAMTSFTLSEHYAWADSAKAAGYLEQGRQAGQAYPVMQAVYTYYAAHLRAQTDPAAAEALFLRADSLATPFRTREAWLVRSKALHRYGVLRQQYENPQQFADIILHQAIPLAAQGGDSALIGKHYFGLGNIFKNNGEFAAAEPYLLTALEISRNSRATDEQMLLIYHCLAENYSLSGKNAFARPLLDSARAILTPYPHSEHRLFYYAAEALYYNTDSAYAAALHSLRQGIALARALGRRYDEQRLQLQRFYALYETGAYGEAKTVLVYLLQQPEMTGIAANRLLLYAGMADTHNRLGDMRQAYTWQKQYSALSDSINASRLKSEIHALDIKFRNAEQQKKITALEAAQQQTTLARKNTRLTVWLLTAAVSLLVAATIFIIFYYRNNKRLYRQRIREMEQHQQLATSHAMIEGEERERTRVARDLHDGLGGMLAGVKFKLSGIAAGDNHQPPPEALDGVISQLDSSVRELRRIARNMMPENLLKFGLETALRDLSDSMSTAATHISFQSYGIAPHIPVSTQVTIYRIVQEALTNALKHAAAATVLLQCSQNGNRFFITIEDDGKGFDVTAPFTGSGLNNIRNRVNYLQGRLDITSGKEEGTTINIELNVTEAT